MAHAEGPRDANDAVNRLLEPRDETAGQNTGQTVAAAPAATETAKEARDHSAHDKPRQKPVRITDWASI